MTIKSGCVGVCGCVMVGFQTFLNYLKWCTSLVENGTASRALADVDWFIPCTCSTVQMAHLGELSPPESLITFWIFFMSAFLLTRTQGLFFRPFFLHQKLFVFYVPASIGMTTLCAWVQETCAYFCHILSCHFFLFLLLCPRFSPHSCCVAVNISFALLLYAGALTSGASRALCLWLAV